MKPPPLSLTPIGVIHTPYKTRGEAPRQAEASNDNSEGRIVLFPGHNFEQALHDLQGFECIWILSWFHENAGRRWRPKVQPPRGGKQRRGVFATRSPYRPNPIGLSRATLIDVRGRTLRVRDTDLLDGTPILDIKPYIPYADAAPGARAGWLDDNPEAQRYELSWAPLAHEQLSVLQEFGVDLTASAARVLEVTVDRHPYRRITKRSDGTRTLAIKSWRMNFSVAGKVVTIESIRSGYPLKRVLHHPGETLDHQAAHVELHRRWPCSD